LEKPRFASSLGWQTANVATQVILQLVFMAVLARLIEPEAFGLMAIALVVVGFVEIFAQVGIGPSVVHKSDLTREHLRSAFVFSLALGVVFFLAMWVAAPLVGEFYNRHELVDVLRVISLSFILSGAAVVPRSLLVKRMHFKQLFLAAVVAMVVGNWCIGLGLAWHGAGVWAYVGALLAQNALLGIAYWYFSPVPVGIRWDGRALREMLGYGTRSTLYNVATYGASKLDTLIVGRWGTGWAATGFYDRSVYLMGLPVTVLGKLSDSVLFSGLASLQQEAERLRATTAAAARLIALVVFPGTVLLAACAHDITVIFLGEAYEPAVPVVTILFLSVPARGLIKLGDAVVRATDALVSAVAIKVGYLVAIAATTFLLLLADHPLEHVAWGIVAATWLQAKLLLILAGQRSGMPIRSWSPTLMPAVLTTLVTAGAVAAWVWTADALGVDAPWLRLLGSLVAAAASGGLLVARNRKAWLQLPG
jgi:O-antigen/teichoic acid export membrane protein